ncbi:hypothetical protein SDC9_120184 [bioreactor metagenome]|uniref:Uncharacterized protein n=1 Tax=bioreactor metagenome TaxID=1076179 RepID=A0A645C753_9ZZZZ
MHAVVLTGTVDDQISVRGNLRTGRERPLGRVGFCVGKAVAGYVNVTVRGVMQLDPVVKFAVLVGHRVVVLGHDLVDDNATRTGVRLPAVGKKKYDAHDSQRREHNKRYDFSSLHINQLRSYQLATSIPLIALMRALKIKTNS